MSAAQASEWQQCFLQLHHFNLSAVSFTRLLASYFRRQLNARLSESSGRSRQSNKVSAAQTNQGITMSEPFYVRQLHIPDAPAA